MKRPGKTGPPTGGMAANGWADTMVLAGRVIDVDPARFTCTVLTEVGQKRLRDVECTSVYLHPFDGEGVHILPDVGAGVWVCRSSSGDYPWFIIAYKGYPSRSVTTATEQNRPDLRTNRPRMAPGEYLFATRDRNGVRIRRGKVTEIFGSPLSKTTYSGRDGKVHTVAKRIRVETLGGSVDWQVQRAELDTRGKQAALLDLQALEYANDESPTIRLEIGGQLTSPVEGSADGDTGVYGPPPTSASVVAAPVLRLRVFSGGDAAAAEAVSLLADTQGQVELAMTGELRVEIRGEAGYVSLSVKPDGSVRLVADGDVTVESGGTLTTRAGDLPVVNDGSAVRVAAGTSPVLLDAGLSAKLAAALSEIPDLANAVGLTVPKTEALAFELEAGVFTAQKLLAE